MRSFLHFASKQMVELLYFAIPLPKFPLIEGHLILKLSDPIPFIFFSGQLFLLQQLVLPLQLDNFSVMGENRL